MLSFPLLNRTFSYRQNNNDYFSEEETREHDTIQVKNNVIIRALIAVSSLCIPRFGKLRVV